MAKVPADLASGEVCLQFIDARPLLCPHVLGGGGPPGVSFLRH